MPVFIASGSLDRKVNVWDAGGHITRSLPFPESQVNCMSYSPHRALLAAGGHGCIRLFTGSSNQPAPPAKGKGVSQEKTKSDGPQKGVLGVTDASMLANAGNVVHMSFVPLASKKGSPTVSEGAAADLGPSWATTLQSWDNAAALLTSETDVDGTPSTQHTAEGVNITKVGGATVGAGEVLATTFFTSCAPKDASSKDSRVPVVVSEDIVSFATDPQMASEDSSSTKHSVWLDVALVAAFEDGSVKVFALKGTTSTAFSIPASDDDTKEQAAPLLYYVRKNANHKKGEEPKPTATGSAPLPLAVLYHRLESVSFHLVRDVPTHVPITSAQCLPSRQVLLTGSQLGRILVWSMPALLGFFDTQTKPAPCTASAHQQLSFGVDMSVAFGGGEMAEEPLSSKAPIIQELALEGDASTIRSIAVAPLMNYIVAATDGGKVHAFSFIQGRRSHVLGSLWSHVQTKLAQGGLEGVHVEVWEKQRVQAGSVTESSWAPLSIGSGAETMMLRKLQRPVRNSNPKYPQACNPYALEQFSLFAAHQQYILSVAVSPNGRYIATSSADSSVCIWKVPEPLALGQFLWFRDLSGSPVAPQPEGAQKKGSDVGDGDSGSNGEGSNVGVPLVSPVLQCASSIADLIIRGRGASRDAKELEMVLSTMAAVASGVRGHYVFAGGVGSVITDDCSLLGTWGLARVLVGHSRWVWNCAVSPCSTYILSVSSDHSGRLWQLPPGLGTPATYASSSASCASVRMYNRDALVAAAQGALTADIEASSIQRHVVSLLKGTLFLPTTTTPPSDVATPLEDLSYEYCWGEVNPKGSGGGAPTDVPLGILQYVEHAAAEAVLEHQSTFYLSSRGPDDGTLMLPSQPPPTTQTATVASFIGHSRPVTCCLLDIYQ